MCMQCMMTAMGATASATGLRSFVAAKHFSWMTPRRLKVLTAVLLSAALLVSATLVSGSTGKPEHQPASTPVHAP
jgi:hypothetical protein